MVYYRTGVYNGHFFSHFHFPPTNEMKMAFSLSGDRPWFEEFLILPTPRLVASLLERNNIQIISSYPQSSRTTIIEPGKICTKSHEIIHVRPWRCVLLRAINHSYHLEILHS